MKTYMKNIIDRVDPAFNAELLNKAADFPLIPIDMCIGEKRKFIWVLKYKGNI